jgi:predicted  nucleic acid-binding Zn-ribbon protein
MDKTLVYRISFDGLEQQVKQIGALDREIADLNKVIADNRKVLDDATKANKQGTEEYKRAEAILGGTIVTVRDLNKAKSDLIRETQNEAKSNQLASGSIVALRAQLAIATKDYNNLSKAERENELVGGKVQARAKALSDELKNLEGAIGDNRRNVGNYKSALTGLETEMRSVIAAQLQLAASGEKDSKAYQDLDNQLKGLSQQYNETATQVAEADNKFKSLTTTTDTATGSVDSLKKQLRQIKEAAAVAGEGTEEFQRLTAEAAVLQDKIDDVNDALKQEKGTEFEKFREQLGGVGQSLGNLDFKQANERIANLGKTLKGLNWASLSSGVKAASGSFSAFGKVLLTNPIFLIAAIVAAVGIALFALKDKVKIIGVAFELATLGPRLLIEAFKDLGDALGLTSFEADAQAEKLSKAAMKRYEAEKLAFEQANEDKILAIQKEIDIQKSLGNDVTKLEIEKRRQIQLSLNEEFKRISALIKLKALIGDNTEEETKRLRELELAYKKLGTEITVIQNEVTNKVKEANDKRSKDNKKSADDIIKINEDAYKSLVELQRENELLLAKTEKERFDLSAKFRREDFEKKLAESEADFALRTALQMEFDNNQDILLKQFLKSQTDQILKARELLLDRRSESTLGGDRNEAQGGGEVMGSDRQQDIEALKKLQDARKQEQIDNANNVAIGLEIASNAANALAAIKDMETEQNIARINREREAQIKAINESTLSEEQKAAKILEINKKADARLNAERKKNAEAQKRLALFQIALDTGKALASAIAAGIAAGPWPANLAAIASGVAAVLGGMVNAKAAVSQANQFEDGGMLPSKSGGFIRGNSHKNGGVKFAVGGRVMEAEGGEIIVNKNIRKRPDFVRAISEMNYQTGGKRFETGGIVPPVFSQQGMNITAQQQMKSQALSFTVPPIQVLNNVTDTSTQQNSIISIQNVASIGG